MDTKNLKASNSQTPTNKINTAPPVKPKRIWKTKMAMQIGKSKLQWE